MTDGYHSGQGEGSDAYKQKVKKRDAEAETNRILSELDFRAKQIGAKVVKDNTEPKPDEEQLLEHKQQMKAIKQRMREQGKVIPTAKPAKKKRLTSPLAKDLRKAASSILNFAYKVDEAKVPDEVKDKAQSALLPFVEIWKSLGDERFRLNSSRALEALIDDMEGVSFRKNTAIKLADGTFDKTTAKGANWTKKRLNRLADAWTGEHWLTQLLDIHTRYLAPMAIQQKAKPKGRE